MRGALAVLLFLPIAASAALNDSACASCHAQQSTHFRVTPMAQALEPVDRCEILKNHSDLQFQEGPYHTRIKREGDRSILTVTHGDEVFTVPLLWAFGRGQAGQTYVFEHDRAMYESRVSFYNETAALDITIGDIGTKPQSMIEAAGRRLSPADAVSCFGCHSNGGVSGGMLHLESVVPGVGCQSCHGQVERHVNAVRAGDVAAAKLPHLADLSAEDMSELCGRCHRTWSQIALTGMRGPNTVRFQPYRITNSKCYDVDDKRIRCTACHDPHGQVNKNLASYDAKCTACHSAALKTKVCRVAKENCVTCHMPKVDLPGAHAQFTDHQIRIARAGAPFPN
jgi:Cytochrome c554 and c-prime